MERRPDIPRVRTSSSRFAHDFSRIPIFSHPISLQRQPAPAATGMSRDDLAKKLTAIYGHDITVEVGDKALQTKDLGGPPAKRKLPDDWQAWDPGTNAPIYDEILRAFEDFGREVGGVPNIKKIVFFNVRYDYDAADNVVAQPTVGAEILRKGGMINIYRASLFETPAGGAATVHTAGIATTTKRSEKGKKGISPVVFPPREESQRRTIAHELGHGVERASGSLEAFEQAVGWIDTGGRTKSLYDIQDRAVQKAITKKRTPPRTALITNANWNSAKHGEQPFSEYAVTDSAEDYAESLSAWIYSREVLKKRSPARFKFFDDAEKRKGWQPSLVTPSP